MAKAKVKKCYYIDPMQDPKVYGGFVVSLVTLNELGHKPCAGEGNQNWVWGKTLSIAKRFAKQQNINRGLTAKEVRSILVSAGIRCGM